MNIKPKFILFYLSAGIIFLRNLGATYFDLSLMRMLSSTRSS